MNIYERNVRDMLAQAGITVGGPNDFDIEVKDSRFYEMVAKQHSLGAGDAYVKGYWDTPDLKKTAVKFLTSDLDFSKYSIASNILYSISNAQNRVASVFNVQKHYDQGYLLYKSFLDERMVYSCGYWHNLDYSPANLDLAQEQKLEMICQKLGLNRQPRGQTILDVGCGFAGFAKYAWEVYGAKVVGITLSGLQYRVAKRICQGLPIEIRFQDYRDIPEGEMYDHIVSVGMFEHVGSKNYRRFILKMKSHLKNEEHGENFFLLHTIFTHGSNTRVDPWISKNIFPGAEIPSELMLFQASQNIFACEDFHDFGLDYSMTADAWYERFNMNYDFLDIKKYHNFEFKRTWDYYLRCSSASFVTRRNDLVQIIFSHHGVLGGLLKIRNVLLKQRLYQ